MTAPDPVAALREEVAGVLGGHRLRDRMCSCSWEVSRTIVGAGWVQKQHEAHLADALLAHLAPLVEARERDARVQAVHARYFDLDGWPGVDDTTPEPEDVWRYDRDFREAAGLPSQERP